ncbi:MAG: ABC transporter permease [Gammaproteobacteria bacterium]|nr:ABC transporter permease [Gammaproteobacteria bacterium]
MFESLFAILTQALLFVPLAFGISISYNILRATDMTLDGSFVLGAAIFARLVTLGYSPYLAFISALAAGALAGMLTASIQRNDRVDPLLAGVLAAFILSSLNLGIMGKPNINLLSQPTLVANAFAKDDLLGWFVVSLYVISLCLTVLFLLKTRLGLFLRAFGDNPRYFKQQGRNIETYRLIGFAITNMLAASAGCLTAQTIGFADVGMGLGVTLTGIGTIILGHHLFSRFYKKHFRLTAEFIACLIGVLIYFFSLSLLLRLNVDPIYLKMILGIVLIIFLRTAGKSQLTGNGS